MRIDGLPVKVDNGASKVRKADHPQPAVKSISPQQGEKIVKFIKTHRKNLIFSFNREANRVVVTIKNGATIQIPDEKILNLSIALKEAAKRYRNSSQGSGNRDQEK